MTHASSANDLLDPAAPETTVATRRVLGRAPDLVVVLVVSAAFGLSFGLNYGVENQVVYLLKALSLANPEILHRDWFTQEVTHYHIAFAYLGAALIALDPSGWLVALLHVLAITIGAGLVYGMVSVLAPPRLALAAFLCVMAIWFVTRTLGVATSYAFDATFQPSTLGSVALLGALYCFARQRWVASGVWLAIGGLFHANYLILAIPTFGLGHLMLGRERLLPRLARQLGPVCLVAILFLPVMLKTGMSADIARAQTILFHIRSAHHYDPRTYEHNFGQFAAWQILGLAAGLPLLGGRSTAGGRLGAILIAMMLVIWTGTLLTTLVYLPRVAQLFAWRLAPFCDLLGALLFCVALVTLVADPNRVRRYAVASLGLVLTAIGLLCVFQSERNPDLVKLMVGFTLVGALACIAGSGAGGSARPFVTGRLGALWSRHGARVVLGLSLVPLALFAPKRLREVPRRSNLIRDSRPAADRQLLRWMRAESPTDALFLTPPDLDAVRFHGNRAIVVDWKGVPIVPAEVVRWYARLNDVCGRRVMTTSDLTGYADLDRERLGRLQAKYQVDYVVVRRGNERRLGDHPVVFANRTYAVLKL
jgi:hypothetical protein